MNRKGVISMTDFFNALVLDEKEGRPQLEVRQFKDSDLSQGDVTIAVAYSSVNFKDGLVAIHGKLVKSFPIIPGIDLAGYVVDSSDNRFKPGDEVIVTSYRLGTEHHGGFSERARVPADWVVPLPKGLSLKEAMILGTAGFTAALSIMRLESNGLKPEQGPVLVAGATGGVGSIAVNILAQRGYEVVASTGKLHEEAYLKHLGASKVIHRSEIVDTEQNSVRKQQWAAAIDPVGGETLQYILSTLQYGGSVATSGLTGGTDVTTTVLPFISRGVNWLGIDSVKLPMNKRLEVWNALATDMLPSKLHDELLHEVTLHELPHVLGSILDGKVRGRTIVNLQVTTK